MSELLLAQHLDPLSGRGVLGGAQGAGRSRAVGASGGAVAEDGAESTAELVGGGVERAEQGAGEDGRTRDALDGTALGRSTVSVTTPEQQDRPADHMDRVRDIDVFD